MKIFSGSSNPALAQKIAGKLNLKLSELEIHIFPDGEKRIRVTDEVVEEDVILIQSTSIPVDQNYIELFLILDALKRSGARSITLVAPYLGYQRQDHIFRDGEEVGFKMMADILENLKVDKLITFDLHSIKLPEFFKIPVVHLTALDLFAEKIDKDSILVSPDMGGIRRIKHLSQNSGLSFATIEKNRDLKTGKVQSEKIDGDVQNKNTAIVDDMISTGETIEAAVELLKKNGAGKISVFATHAVFADGAEKLLSKLPVEQVVVTDTIDIPQEKRFPKLEILSVADLIYKNL
ncbi:MAG TPA: ribose-phosphate pyrophosphokinase [Patescibacteria group bacterium]|nr:ribose-phosphate pyrophosphokinase [Patescibacteria group bacterium]